jgi:oligopeptide transport system permease protein|tara:strand:- start:2987 stop:4249 length:1263 start_codon:yes stop_codon:yes gene_type:complete
MALGSGVVLLGLVLSALIGPLLSPYGFADGNLGLGATRPMERIIERAHLSVVDHPSNGQLGFSHFVSELGDKVSLDRLFPEISNQVRSELTAAGSPLVQLGLADLGFTFTDSETLGAQLSQSTLTEAELRLTDLGTAIYDLDSEERVVLRSALDEIRSIVRSAFASASKPLEEVLEGDPLSLEGMGVPLIYTLSGERHWFGTDELGRDLLVRVLVGGRVSLGVGVVAALVALIIGVLYGSISGYVGGAVDNLMMRIVDILYSLPFTIFVILLMTVFERSLWLLFLAIGAVEWLTMARVVRAQVLTLKGQEFLEAARMLGLPFWKIVLRYLIPNTLGPVIVLATLTIPAVMLLESVLSFLGLGVQAPLSSWGSLISEGADRMDVYPWTLIFPAVFFSLTLFCLSFLGDGLRDAIDPKTSKN